MKKFFLAGLGVVALSLVLMVACSEPSTDYTVTPGALPKFRVDTTVAQGGVLLTWQPVANAEAYEVWRYKASDQVGGVLLATLSAQPNKAVQLRYADVKGVSNNLIATDYKYTVVAVGRPGLSNTGITKTVKITAANLPESITLEGVAGLKLEVTSDYRVVATWDADSNPLVQYQVSYNSEYYDEVTEKDVLTLESVLTFANFVVVDNPVEDVVNVQVRKVLGDGLYYKPSTATTASVTVFELANSKLASVDFYATRDNNRVKLEFDHYKDFSLEQYDIQRINLVVDAGSGKQVASGEWTAVSLDGALLMEDTDQYAVYDTLPADAENTSFLYRLIVRYPNSNLIFGYAKDTVQKWNIPSLAVPGISIEKNTKLPDDPSQTVDDLAAYLYITYDIESGATYTVYRKQTSGPNGISVPGADYDWTAVTGDKIASSATSETLKVNVPEGNARTSYDYKVVATKSGYKSAESNSESNQFRSSLTTPSSNSAATPYFDLSYDDDYESVGVRQNDDGDTIATVYKLSINGFGKINNDGVGLLRTDESFTVEIYGKDGAPTAGDSYKSQKVTKAKQPWTGTADNKDEPDTEGYYFLMPAAPKSPNQGSYAARLSVTAK